MNGARAARKLALGVLALWTFVLALAVLKAGVGPLGPFVRERLQVDDIAAALGFGWILAYVVLSGSPVAATAITFYSEEVIDAYQAFAMIAGSRFGAAMVVLVIGLVYHLRRNRDDEADEPQEPARGRRGGWLPSELRVSLEMGVLSLLTTFAIYFPALPIGFAILRSHALDGVTLQPRGIVDGVALVTRPFVAIADRFLPAGVLVLGGFVLLVLSLKLFDSALPDLGAVRVRTSRPRVFRPVVMFGIGLAVTLLTLSVSVSLGLLVPLAVRGIARRENVIPYIMGANVSTFVDTLFAALLVGEAAAGAPSAAVVVLAEMLSVGALSLGAILFFYHPLERTLLNATRAILRSRQSLGLFLAIAVVVPVTLLVI